MKWDFQLLRDDSAVLDMSVECHTKNPDEIEMDDPHFHCPQSGETAFETHRWSVHTGTDAIVPGSSIATAEKKNEIKFESLKFLKIYRNIRTARCGTVPR